MVAKLIRNLKIYGIRETIFKVKQKLSERKGWENYEIFINEVERDILKTKPLDYRPMFSFVVPVYNVVSGHLRECIDSILNQTYDNFELILVDDKSTWGCVAEVLREYEKHPKVTVIYRQEKGHISKCTNTGIEAAKGEFIVFCDCDDVIAVNAVYEMTRVVNKDSSVDFIYSDEDKLTEDGKKRYFPHFKPDWSPDTLMSFLYTTHLSAYRRGIVNEIGGLRTEFNGSQDYDFALRFTEKTDKVAHIPKILYHWRQSSESCSTDISAKPCAIRAVFDLKQEALERRGIQGKLVYLPEIQQYRVRYDPVGNPLVSIIILSKDNYYVLKRCIRSILEKTTYKNYEILIIDNGSSEAEKEKYQILCDSINAVYYYEKQTFNFAKMSNKGAALAKGEYLLFLNDDVEAIEGDWLKSMLGQATLAHTGAVGAKLLYPNSTLIQHCGVLNMKYSPRHALKRMDDNETHYFGRNKADYNYLAVTAACLCISTEKFYAVNGFDEKFVVAYNDVDLCFKLYEKGWYNVVKMEAVLYHHESLSRGDDFVDEKKLKRLEREKRMLYKKHPKISRRDPFYNVNLSIDRPDFYVDTNL